LHYQDWINDLSLGEFFDRQADKRPAHKALITPDQGDFTFGALKDISDQLAQGMMSVGIKRGDKIGVWAHNIPEWVFLFLGISKLGAVMVPINPNARSHDLAYYLKTAEVKVLFLVKKINGTDNEEILKKAVPDLHVFSSGEVASEELPLFKKVIVIGDSTTSRFLHYEDLLKEASKVRKSDLPFLKEKISPSDPVLIIYLWTDWLFPRRHPYPFWTDQQWSAGCQKPEFWPFGHPLHADPLSLYFWFLDGPDGVFFNPHPISYRA